MPLVPDKKSLLVSVVPSWGGRTLQWVVPLGKVRLLIAGAAVTVALLLLVLVAFARVAAEAVEARRLGEENDSLRTRFARLEQLEAEVAELSKANEQMRRMAGIDYYPAPEDAGPAEDPVRESEGRADHAGWQPTLPTVRPRPGPISRQFLTDEGGGCVHPGIDLPSPAGAPILAAGSGIVTRTAEDSVYGLMVVVDHGGGLESVYGHTRKLLVAEGDTVTEGSRIAQVGSTGLSTAPHLHFEIRMKGQAVDPATFLAGQLR